MSEMIERVARAIYRSVDCAADLSWDEADEAVKESCRRDARGAIEAMREPTETMIQKAVNAPVHGWNNQGRDGMAPDSVFYWRAMIDAALA